MHVDEAFFHISYPSSSVHLDERFRPFFRRKMFKMHSSDYLAKPLQQIQIKRQNSCSQSGIHFS